MLFALILTIHVIVCLVLIASVLVQQGKGATMGAAFGTAGSQTVFGSSGAGNFLTKTTSVCAVIFFSTSLILAYRSSFRRSVVEGEGVTQTAPEAAPPTAPAAATSGGSPPVGAAPVKAAPGAAANPEPSNAAAKPAAPTVSDPEPVAPAGPSPAPAP